MKTKALFLVAVTAVVTLSFTFVSTSQTQKDKIEKTKESYSAPIGGFASEEKL
jgi:hypothetical protein